MKYLTSEISKIFATLKIGVFFLISFAIASQAHANMSDGFLHLWMKDGKFERIQYRHGQLDIGSVLTKSKLMNVKVHNGESFLEYRAQSKDGLFTIIDKVGFGGSSLTLDLNNITEMHHADYYYKDFKWQLSGPSIDSFYNVLAELEAVDDENVIQNSFTIYSIGAGKGEISCYLDRGGNGQPARNPPVKACVFTER